jgi:hypothetical protein
VVGNQKEAVGKGCGDNNFRQFSPLHLPLTSNYKMQRPASTSAHSAVSPRPPVPAGHQVNTQTKILDTIHGRILCVADIRGRLSALNDLAREANAQAVIHTGDFGFFGEY